MPSQSAVPQLVVKLSPQQHPKIGFPREKIGNWRPTWQKTHHLLHCWSQQAKCLQPRFGAGALSALLSSSNMVQMGLSGCSSTALVSFYLSLWSNGFLWLIRWKPEIKNAANNWTGRKKVLLLHSQYNTSFPVRLEFIHSSPYLPYTSWRVCICNHHQCYPHIFLKGIIQVVVYNGRRLGSHTYVAFLILHS